MIGTCVFYDPLKGWGFIWCEETDIEFFVHKTAIAGNGRKRLSEGDRVSFESGQHNGKTVAVSVQRLDPSGHSGGGADEQE